MAIFVVNILQQFSDYQRVHFYWLCCSLLCYFSTEL